jgi:hypothetical protein
MITPKTSYFVIAILLIFNIFMLYQNVQRENRVGILSHQLSDCEKNTGNPSMRTASFQLPGELIILDNTLTLVTFFTDRGCAPCVIDIIGFINDMLNTHSPYMNMFLIEGHERYLVNLGAQFRYEVIDPTPELEDLHISNPVSLLIDQNGTVHHIHYAETGNIEKSRLFFNNVNSLFESVYGG